MAPWGDAKLFLCILFITCCCSTVTLAEITFDCCLSVRNKTISRPLVGDYSRQIAGLGCSIDAMIFVPKANRNIKLCVPHDELWVHKLVKHVDALKKFCKKNNYKPKRCDGVKQE